MSACAEFDAVVVGAGPAGSITAALLAEQGLRVCVVERAVFPRAKPCGESLNPGAVRELRRLGLERSVLELAPEPIRRWRVHPYGDRSFEGAFPGGEAGLGVARSRFDALLLDRTRDAGAEVRTGVRVVDLMRNGVSVEGVRTAAGEELRARLVVGADGLRSVVVRRLDLLRRRPAVRKTALTAHVIAAEIPAATGILQLTGWGCIGIARVTRTETNVVLVVDGHARGSLGGAVAERFDELMRESEYLREARRISEVMATGPFDWPTRAVVADGAILVGDASGYFDPLTGQGIYRALRGAQLAARIFGPALRAGEVGAAQRAEYGSRHRQEFSMGERVQQTIEIGVARPALFRRAAGVLRAFPRLTTSLLGLTGDIVPRRPPLTPLRTS